jgi:hypothetical protein
MPQLDDGSTLSCWAAAAWWIVLSVAFVIQPAEFSPGISFPLDLTAEQIGAFWQARPDESIVHIALHVSALVAALVTIGMIVRVSRLLDGKASWASCLAIVGMAVMAVSNIRYLPMERTYARLFLEASPEAQPAVAVASASLSLDPYGFLEFGTLGVWICAVTVVLGSRRTKTLVVTSVLGALGLFGMVFGSAVWAPALAVAPMVGTPALVVWLLLLPGALDGQAQLRDSP